MGIQLNKIGGYPMQLKTAPSPHCPAGGPLKGLFGNSLFAGPLLGGITGCGVGGGVGAAVGSVIPGAGTATGAISGCAAIGLAGVIGGGLSGAAEYCP